MFAFLINIYIVPMVHKIDESVSLLCDIIDRNVQEFYTLNVNSSVKCTFLI